MSFGIAQAEACGAHEPCSLPSPVDLGSTRLGASVVVAVLSKKKFRLLLLSLVRRGACNCGFFVSRTPPPSTVFGLRVSQKGESVKPYLLLAHVQEKILHPLLKLLCALDKSLKKHGFGFFCVCARLACLRWANAHGALQRRNCALKDIRVSKDRAKKD